MLTTEKTYAHIWMIHIITLNKLNNAFTHVSMFYVDYQMEKGESE